MGYLWPSNKDSHITLDNRRLTHESYVAYMAFYVRKDILSIKRYKAYERCRRLKGGRESTKDNESGN
ncbi:hypothetical protein TNCV_3112801 [Trichonephila clavipes]|nr:hypothetical protein TNCV_3112801 [Trichonephila clavipes]